MSKKTKRNARTRRGVLLLVVLGLLAMFAMVAITWVVMSSHERTAATTHGRGGQQYDPPAPLLDSAMDVVLIGSNGKTSAVTWCSLLEKIWGNDTMPAAQLVNPTKVCGGQLIEFTLVGGVEGARRVGCVLTMLNGPATGLSTYIVGFNPSDPTRVQMMAFEGGVMPQAGNTFIVNGMAFSGQGVGYNPATGRLDGAGAFLPNHPDNVNSAGGVNCGYTAPDCQDPLLAFQVPNSSVVSTPIPSLHRPELINYLVKKSGGANWKALPADTLRAAMFRPNPTDHPQFDGSNPNFDAAWNGLATPGGAQRWDVDNDGDGLTDSVWVDLGMPVRDTADGKKYKPLFALLILDMDGRLNLNAHGSLAQAAGDYYLKLNGKQGVAETLSGQVNVNSELNQVASLSGNTAAAAAGTLSGATPILPRGQGSGPADVSLAPLFGGPDSGKQIYRSLLAGRYGNDGAPGAGGSIAPATANRWTHYNGFYWSYRTDAANYWPDAFGAPPDIHGIGAVGVDPAGQPLYLSMGGNIMNTPYDINLSLRAPRGGQTSIDTPFGPAELERALRPFDRDAPTLPSRILSLTSTTGDPLNSVLLLQRTSITTESTSVPVPSLAMPPALRAALGGNRPRHIVDIVAALGVPQAKWTTLLPPEMLCGLKMNLNRPLSNWRPAGYEVYKTPGATWQAGQNGFTLDPSGAALDPSSARQLQARYLYVLACLFWQQGGQVQCIVENLDANQKNDLIKRRIAQWAINAVCFSTPDSVMVPFQYDPNPLSANGWQANLIGPSTTAEAFRAFPVVWGCKPPEAVLTEAAAWHARRVADTAFDSGPKKKRTDEKTEGSGETKKTIPADEDLDQPRIPQGNLFLELFCTRNTRTTVAPADLYTSTGSKDWCLDLGRLSPAAGDGCQYPVWRVVITESTLPGAGDPKNNVATRLYDRPDSTSLEPEQCRQAYPGKPNGGQFSLLTSSTEVDVKIDRIIWFAAQNPSQGGKTCMDADRIYWNQWGSSALLAGRSYAVVGPRKTTYVGSRAGGSLGDPAKQRIVLAPTANQIPTAHEAQIMSTAGTDTLPAAASSVKPIRAIIVSGGGPNTSWPTGWANMAQSAPKGIGVSVSEPLFSQSCYYTEPRVTAGPDNIMEWYGKPDQTGAELYLDHPLEPDPTRANDTEKSRPLVKDNLVRTGTTQNYKYVMLQRLANPAAAYDPVLNPYRTVDWMPVDLTVFNGDDRRPTEWPPTAQKDNPNWPQQWDPDDSTDGKGKTQFAARQRGTLLANDPHYGTTTQGNLWAQVSNSPSDSVAGSDTNACFNYDLQNTLGFLNKAYQDPAGAPGWITGAGGGAGAYVGEPTRPFPWITWNARPYMNELELLLVPACPASRLLWEFKTVGANPDQYVPAAAQAQLDQVPFPYLINFFQSAGGGVGGTAGEMHRLLEFVGVPSPFPSSTVQINPVFAVGNAGSHIFHPPFQFVPTYREPGRININTISSPEVFFGLVNYFPGMANGIFWEKFVRSRRGYARSGSNAADPFGLADMNSDCPTRFAGAFRPSGTGAIAPPREVETTLLRSDPDNASLPLFRFSADLTPQGVISDANNPDRNAYFRYEGLSRLGSVVTNRSNVFAVWITVGYFEAIPCAQDAAHPDGYQLGQEIGSDTGQISRHRAFYLIDRSIPAGFMRGQSINQSKTVLLKRFIE